MTSLEHAPDEVDDFLALYPTSIALLAQRLRTLVKRAAPDTFERVRQGWHLIGYDLPVTPRRTIYFAWVMPELKHVHVGWQTGTLMSDPDAATRRHPDGDR